MHALRTLAFLPRLSSDGAALRAGATVLADGRRVAEGITRARLPADNPVRCSRGDPRTQALARRLGTTRSAAAVDRWGDDLAGAVVAIGNVPTALYRLDRQSVV